MARVDIVVYHRSRDLKEGIFKHALSRFNSAHRVCLRSPSACLRPPRAVSSRGRAGQGLVSVVQPTACQRGAGARAGGAGGPQHGYQRKQGGMGWADVGGGKGCLIYLYSIARLFRLGEHSP